MAQILTILQPFILGTVKSIGCGPLRELENIGEASARSGWSRHLQGNTLLLFGSMEIGCKLHRPDAETSRATEAHLAAFVDESVAVYRDFDHIVGADPAKLEGNGHCRDWLR